MSKKWLILGSVSFSVGLSLSLIVNKDIKQAALTGLLSIPTTTAGVLVTEYQRKQKLNDRISTKQEQLQGLIQQEAELNHSIPLLFDRIENLKQQEEDIKAVISSLDTDKQRCLQLATQSRSKLDTLHNRINRFEDCKLNLEQEIKTQKFNLQQLREQKITLTKSIEDLFHSQEQVQEETFNLAKQKQTLIKQINSQQYSLNQLQQQKSNLKNAITTITNDQQKLEQQFQEQQQQLTAETNSLQSQSDSLRQHEKEAEQTLFEIEIEKQQVVTQLIEQQQKYDLLQEQIVNQKNKKLQLDRELWELKIQEVEAQKTKSQLNLEIEQLQQQTVVLNQSIASLNQEKQAIESQAEALETTLSDLETSVFKQQDFAQENKLELTAEIDKLQQNKVKLDLSCYNLKLEKQAIKLNCITSKTQLSQLQNLVLEQQQLKEELANLLVDLEHQKQELLTQIEQLQSQITKEEIELEQLSGNINKPKIDSSELIIKETIKTSDLEQTHSVRLNSNNDDLRNSKYTKQLWETEILPYWNHKDRPAGYRFLGNVTIEYTKSKEIIEIIGQNLQKLAQITDNLLQQSFFELEQNWIKIITFALSEYAYYYSNERFWEGFCDHIGIKHSQTVENTLRQVTERGINLLGLVRATGGYKYVSTLWLQSGVPKQNLGHFATIVQDVANEYGWWEISHSSALDIAKTLWQCWENRYSQWGTIKHFINIDNSNEDLEPISGQLVKNIAIIARELEYKNLSFKAIQDRAAREELIGNSNLSYSFFLRDWSDLITVLTPHTGRSDRSIAKKSNQPPYLYLDIANTLNTQLILPKQSLWKKEWQNLRNTYCLIPEAGWENDIPSHGNLEIPELEIDIKQATDKWSYQLQNNHRNQIHQWEHEGINSEFSCLVFDAISGGYIQIDISEPKIIEIEGIILFTPREVEIEFDNNIEVIDSFVPSSIKGWRGKEVRLVESEALIQIQSIIISWQLQKQEQPQLIGLRLKGKKVIYINAPTLYYPPQEQNIIINYSIESIDCRTTIAKDCLNLPASDKWSQIELSQWIKESGNYQAEFWQQEKQWSYRFEVRDAYQIFEYQGYRNFKIYDHNNNLLPISAKYENVKQSLLEVIKLNNLYPLEELTLNLKSNSEQYNFQQQADNLGNLTLSLACLYDCLLECDRYSLDVKQSGSELKRILQVGYFITWRLTATALTLKGLPPENNYSLSGWNLLNPNKKLEKINLSTLNLDKVTTNISFSPGIYHIQLYHTQQLIDSIGLWCGIDPQNIPKAINNDEVLANYCYTILGNESLEEFSDALKQINTNFERERIQIILDDLHKENYYLPEWLHKDSLTNKIQKILETLLVSPSVNSVEPKSNTGNMEITNQPTTISGQWCLVTVRQWKRDSFLKYLNNDIKQKQLQELILEVVKPEEAVYDNMVLLRISSFIEVRKALQPIEHFKSIQRLNSNEASRMLNK